MVKVGIAYDLKPTAVGIHQQISPGGHQRWGWQNTGRERRGGGCDRERDRECYRQRK